MIPAIIIDVSGIWNASLCRDGVRIRRHNVAGLPAADHGEQYRHAGQVCPRAIAIAIGATVMTATSINTPTAVSTIVANASANSARVSPNLRTNVSAIVFAPPDSIRTPASTPVARMRDGRNHALRSIHHQIHRINQPDSADDSPASAPIIMP